MIAGRALDWSDGGTHSEGEVRRLPALLGILIVAGSSQGGISVSDLRGTRFLGVVRGVGWAMNGGLLDRVMLDARTLELYGKRVVRWNGGVFGLDTYHGLNDESYEFFLLRRPAGGGRAEILAKFDIPPSDVEWRFGGEADEATRIANARRDVRGTLHYDAATKTALVTITGLKQPFERSVSIDGGKAGAVR